MNKKTQERDDNEETTDEASFEENLEDLEDIVSQLEQGDLPLEQALELYEQGVSAYRDCHQKLENAESKVVELVETLEGDLDEEEFEISGEEQ